jgi:hypothetical protein
MLVTPSQIGARSEAAVASALVRAGKTVYVPAFGAPTRVDLIVEGFGRLSRIQCKTARVKAGVLVFHTCSNTGAERKSYIGQIDEFGVYAPELDLVYVVPVEEAPSMVCSLRLQATKNNQVSCIRWASDYLLGPP